MNGISFIVNQMTKPAEHKYTPLQEKLYSHKDDITKAFKNGKTVGQLATKYGTSQSAMRSVLVANGIKPMAYRSRPKKVKAAAAKKALSGQDIEEVAKDHGVAESTIRTWVKQFKKGELCN